MTVITGVYMGRDIETTKPITPIRTIELKTINGIIQSDTTYLYKR